MKCIVNKTSYLYTVLVALLCSMVLFTGCSNSVSLNEVELFEIEHYNRTLGSSNLFASQLAVSSTDVPMGEFALSSDNMAAALIDTAAPEFLYAFRLHERISPATATKIMTVYVALQYGNLDDMITMPESALDLPDGVVMTGLHIGDQISLGELLTAMILTSGNDAAIAIAEHISGSEAAFVQLMNEEARALAASNTHFANAHGLHNDDQFTTVYDLYLIFNACIMDHRFLNIIDRTEFSADVRSAEGEVRVMEWFPANGYNRGWRNPPEGIVVVGGKTGSGEQAGSGLILLVRDASERPYIAIMMGAPSVDARYENMNRMWSEGILHEATQ